eukprot:363083-Chlamydomonas_euryale.AAC.2
MYDCAAVGGDQSSLRMHELWARPCSDAMHVCHAISALWINVDAMPASPRRIPASMPCQCAMAAVRHRLTHFYRCNHV